MAKSVAQELLTPPAEGRSALRPAGTFLTGGRFFARAVDKKLIAAALLAAAPALAAFGLAVTFPDLVMEQVAPGSVFRSVQDKNIPYLVANRTDGPVDIEVFAETRSADQVKAGYEPVPDAGWLKVVPDKIHLEKGEKASAEFILSVPKDKGLIGRHFEAVIHARTVAQTFLSAGVLHTVRFSVGAPAPEEKVPPKKK